MDGRQVCPNPVAVIELKAVLAHSSRCMGATTVDADHCNELTSGSVLPSGGNNLLRPELLLMPLLSIALLTHL